jgi:hypothetical protein
MTTDQPNSIRQYFVDEAGDSVLFDSRGRVIVGTQGCSRFFSLGVADIAEPDKLAKEMEELRTSLLADSYFRGVPSMRLDGRKTASGFHATNDLPEVRREVFSLILKHQVKFFAVVQSKQRLLDYVRQRNEQDDIYRYRPDEHYDYLVKRLFKQLLHKHDEYNITFAKRGSANRTDALRNAIEAARMRFCEEVGITTSPIIDVGVTTPPKCSGLQVVDYFLWALQRLYERAEDRYIQFVWPLVGLVHDLDVTEKSMSGTHYTKKRPLTLAALESSPGI